MKKKTCEQCLHLEICKYKNEFDIFLKNINKENNFKSANEYFTEIAEYCKNYLIYDKRSIESFLLNIKDAQSCLKWTLDMCTNNDKPCRKTLINGSEKWFAYTFVDALQRGKKSLDELIKII